jgi:peptidoglycan hydrolase-like protein with peptidoglycan-binding domain
VRITSGETTILVYEETLRRVQKQLADRKLYNSRIDGKFGDGTRRALEAFQKAENIAATGLPDQLTLFRLSRPASGAADVPPPAATPGPAQRPRPQR